MGMREKYALTAEGAKNIRLGAFWTVVVNLVAMFGIGFFFYLMEQLIASLTEGAALPDMIPYAVGLVIFAVVLWVAHWFQYDYTYGKTYRESGKQRISLGERMRELPLSFFGKRDLADLTETIMTDATTMEHVYSHVLPYLYGTYISTAIIAVCLLAFNWQLAIAALWSVPVASLLCAAHAQDARLRARHDGEHPRDAGVRSRDSRHQSSRILSQASRRLHRST